MKTPKIATPMPKSKLNTPRSGFIKKSGSSVKQMKANVLENSVVDFNGTPKIDTPALKKVQSVAFNGSAKKNKSPMNNVKSPKKENPLKTPIMSPLKRKVIDSKEDGDEHLMKKQRSPKTQNKIEKTPPVKKNKTNKASPEVQLGLDIEHFLDKSSILNKRKEMGKGTPLGTNKKVNKTVDLKLNKKNKKLKGKDEEKQVVKTESENNEIVPAVTLRNAVNALVKYVDENPKEKEVIFGVGTPFYLQVNYIHKPLIKRSRILVPHSILPENADVALIVCDKKGDEEKELEDVIDEMKERLQKCGVNKIPEIIPWRKACLENTQYEQKRKFLDRFDMILIDCKLLRMFKKYFLFTLTRNRLITPVVLNFDKDINKTIERAFRKLPLQFQGKGLTKTLKFGHYKMNEQHLVENLDAILKEMSNNSYYIIKSISLKTQKSINFPLYMTTKTANSVKRPQPKVTNAEEAIAEGELSTFPDRVVKVYKDGTVKTRKIKSDEKNKKTDNETVKEEVEDDDEIDEDVDDSEMDEDEDEDDLDDDDEVEDEEEDDEDEDDLEFESEEDSSDENMSEDEEEININKLKNKKRQKGKNIKGVKNNEEQDGSTDEDQLDAAEEMFLKELRREQDQLESKSGQKKGKKALPSSQGRNPQLKAIDKQKGKQLLSQKLKNVPQKNESQKKTQNQQQHPNKKPQKGKNFKSGKNNDDEDKGKSPTLLNQNKKPQLKVPGGNKQIGQQQKLAQKPKNFPQTNMTKGITVNTEGETFNKKSKNKRRKNKKKGNFGSGQASPQQTKVLATPRAAIKMSPKGKKAPAK